MTLAFVGDVLGKTVVEHKWSEGTKPIKDRFPPGAIQAD
jgi:hypothetical protein